MNVGCEAICDSAVYRLVTSELAKGNARMPCHAEFAAAFMRQLQRKKGLMRAKRRREADDKAALPVQSEAHHLGAMDSVDADEGEAEPFDVFPSLDSEPSALSSDPFDDWDEPDGPPLIPSEVSLDEDLSAMSRSFESLCREHLDAYLHSADEFVHSTALTQRVRDWQEKLEPILEEEDAHPSFDILAYGDRMLGTLVESQQDEVDGEGQCSLDTHCLTSCMCACWQVVIDAVVGWC